MVWVLTNVWRRCGVGVALILSAAVDKEKIKGGVALLPVVSFREAAPLLYAVHPGVEADVSMTGSIYTCAFLILTCALQISIILGI